MTFNKQQEYIKKYLVKFTRDRWLIDELCQVINIKLHNSKSKEKTKGLLYTMVKSVYIDHYRKVNSKRYNTVVYEKYDGNSEFRPDEMVIKKEDTSFILKCIEELPEKQKEVVYLRYYGNLNFFEICDIMKCPKNTALSYMHKAKANLKILLTKKPNNYET